MSLLDSACRIGHRKYLLNELVMRPTNTHDTFSDSKSRRQWTDGFANPSISGRARIPRSFESTRIPVHLGIPGFANRSILGCSDFSKPEDPRNFVFSDFGNAGSLGPWIRTIGIENPWVLIIQE